MFNHNQIWLELVAAAYNSKIMSLNLTKNILVRKTLFPSPKDTERYFLRKDTSERIHKDTHKRYIFPNSKDTFLCLIALIILDTKYLKGTIQ